MGPDVTYVHCNAISGEELRLVADSGGTASAPGEPAPGLPAGPIAVEVTRDGEPLAATAYAEAATGALAGLVAYVARYLHEFGAELRPGELIISGSTVPLIEVAPGQRIRSAVAGAGAVEILLS